MMKMKYLFYFAVLGLASCAPSTFVKPLEKGQYAATANLGGPLIGFAGTTIPVPMTGLAVGYGATEKTTAFARIHTTSALFGVAQLELGATHQFADSRGWVPGFSASAQAHFMFDRWEHNFRFYPQVDLNAFWNLGKEETNNPKDFVYLGASNWLELRKIGTGGRAQETNLLPAIHGGYTLVKEKYNYALECKYIAPFTSNQSLVADYKSPSNNGAIGVYFSITRKF
jgi:hypothetical protein